MHAINCRAKSWESFRFCFSVARPNLEVLFDCPKKTNFFFFKYNFRFFFHALKKITRACSNYCLESRSTFTFLSEEIMTISTFVEIEYLHSWYLIVYKHSTYMEYIDICMYCQIVADRHLQLIAAPVNETGLYSSVQRCDDDQSTHVADWSHSHKQRRTILSKMCRQIENIQMEIFSVRFNFMKWIWNASLCNYVAILKRWSANTSRIHAYNW